MASAAADLERRKQLRLRLRPDVIIEEQKYEGKTFYVMKDPISLRYYRIKEYERYLLTLFDGEHTLEDAQKAYEDAYRPERIRLEDLEAFAQQLLLAGLVVNDSPRAGNQLYERRRKRKTKEWMQTLTNILYIKVPVFDPDRILTAMLRYTRWIFTFWFFAVSVGFMLSALVLVATNFQMFLSKLPDYHEFFNVKTVIYLWIALAIVKVIHEFGHGLSCKAFGGEVHEMGLLFLCLSPAMYCNVSDSWTMPNKWHRIIISFAGIYVELVIASFATWVWWHNPASPFIAHMALSLMVVCSVSTFVFNANPLMRFDGYYVLADWIEIPNLREKSNRYLSNLMQKHCLGIEVPPEPYMALGRRIGFVAYAVISYVYRWIVTFGVLLFLYHFLRPYKLEILSNLLTLLAIGSMVGWPAYNLGKSLYQRGRLPDMKSGRVWITGSVLVILFLVAFFVRLPINRVLSTGLVMASPDGRETVRIHHDGKLERLLVKEGQEVTEGQEIAVFSNFQVDTDQTRNQLQQEATLQHVEYLTRQRDATPDGSRRAEVEQQIKEQQGQLLGARADARTLNKIKNEFLLLRAPRAGVVVGLLAAGNLGRSFPADTQVCEIHQPGQLLICLPVEPAEWNQIKENVQPLTWAAQQASRGLQTRVSIECRGRTLSDALHELLNGKKIAGLNLEVDPDAHLAESVLREPITLDARNQRVGSILDRLLTPFGLGYYIRSETNHPHDGYLVLRPGSERGLPMNPTLAPMPVAIRVQGRDSKVFKGRMLPLPETEKEKMPIALTNKAGGPIAVKSGSTADNLIPQIQHYLVYIEMLDADAAVLPGNMAVVKIYCKPMTCAGWVWRKINSLFDLSLW